MPTSAMHIMKRAMYLCFDAKDETHRVFVMSWLAPRRNSSRRACRRADALPPVDMRAKFENGG